jgi:hypothetical protein
MPAEVTSAPGYRPFTLGPDSQEWVDSMAEVVDGGKAVYGRPKPVTPKSHRSLASTPPPAPNIPPQSVFTVPAARVEPRPAPRRIVMPDIPGAPPARVRTLPPRIVMPDIGGDQPAHATPHGSVPEIGTEAAPPVREHATMPDIGGETSGRAAKGTRMPEIGEEGQPLRPSPRMPEIGEP